MPGKHEAAWRTIWLSGHYGCTAGIFSTAKAMRPGPLRCATSCAANFLCMLCLIGDQHEAARRWEEAAEIYQRGLELDNLAEELYRRLIVTYQKRGQLAGALEVYRRCRRMLSVVLGVGPSKEIEVLYQTLKSG
jgi:tetratricopeptide (TPR) repeat protein